MNREDNAYFTLAEKLSGLKTDVATGIYIGTVISISPLLVQVEGIQLDRQDLLINSDILKGAKIDTKINDSDNISTITNIEDKFSVGSKVVLLSQDNQKFILLCEVI